MPNLNEKREADAKLVHMGIWLMRNPESPLLQEWKDEHNSALEALAAVMEEDCAGLHRQASQERPDLSSGELARRIIVVGLESALMLGFFLGREEGLELLPCSCHKADLN